MKKAAFIILAGMLFASAAGEANYQSALEAVALTNGSDLEIVQTMRDHGFDGDVFETITPTQKFLSTFKKITR